VTKYFIRHRGQIARRRMHDNSNLAFDVLLTTVGSPAKGNSNIHQVSPGSEVLVQAKAGARSRSRTLRLSLYSSVPLLVQFAAFDNTRSHVQIDGRMSSSHRAATRRSEVWRRSQRRLTGKLGSFFIPLRENKNRNVLDRQSTFLDHFLRWFLQEDAGCAHTLFA
jgi:hypothetical protein